MDRQKEEMEIDLLDLFHYLKKRVWIICAVVVVFAMIGFLITSMFIPAEYTASTRIYILNRQNENNVVYSDYQIANYIISDYKVLITGRNVTEKVVNALNLNMSPDQLSRMIQVSSPNNTRVLQISVTYTSAQQAADIANAVREYASEQIKAIMDVDAVNLVYAANTPTAPSGPSVVSNTAIAAIAGLVVIVGIFAVVYILDDAIHTEEDVEKYLGLGTLGVIPVSSALNNNSQSKNTTRSKFLKANTGKKK